MLKGSMIRKGEEAGLTHTQSNGALELLTKILLQIMLKLKKYLLLLSLGRRGALRKNGRN